MGKHADQALEMVFQHENDRLDYHTGTMSQEKAYDLGIIDELGYESHPSILKACKKCGKPNLFWRQTKHGKWWLANQDGTWHTCKT